MEFNCVTMNLTGGHLVIVDPKGKTRFLTFRDRPTTELFIDYLANHRSKYGKWPNMDMSKSLTKFVATTRHNKRSPESVKEYLDIVTYNRDALDILARTTGTSYLYVHNFGFITDQGTENVTFSGQEVDGVGDLQEYCDTLEYNMRVKWA